MNRPVTGREETQASSERGMPPEAPVRMPPQALTQFDVRARRSPAQPRGLRSSRLRRLLVLGGAATLSVLAVNEMRLVLEVDRLTVVKYVVLGLFAFNIGWISLPFVVALVGLLRVLSRRREQTTVGALSSRTALLMPVYNEDPARVASALDAMGHDIVAQGEGHSFDLFLLSDTNHGDIAIAEEEAVWLLRRRLGNRIRVYYRRRANNSDHKLGNIRDFCERWGAAYDHLLLADADSLLEGATVVRLAKRMEADPDAGLIQTLPRLHRSTTLMARVQQFAGRVYGEVLGCGLAWWTGKEGNFWGHNAIVRTQAFVTSAGLPALPGRPPFGGAILSHDFVEAALLRRSGWSVLIADDLDGSYEECPSSLVDLATRDRRWCQGNLQHLRLLTAKGLHWMSRLHLLGGILSYLASPLWLLFVLAALALGVEYEFTREVYFSHALTLFPLWPHIDPVRAERLFGATLGILLGPKVFGALSVLLSPKRLRLSGGLMLFLSGFLLEIVASALLAPILMLIHCGLVFDILRGRDSGWHPQQRVAESSSWSRVFLRHRWHTVAGFALAAISYSVSLKMLAWMSPALAGMVLAAPLSRLTGSLAVGCAVKRSGLLRTPEETTPPAITRAADASVAFYRDALSRCPNLSDLARDSRMLQRHMALADNPPSRPNGEVDAVEAGAERKIRDALTVEDAVACLTARERAQVQASPTLLLLLASIPAGYRMSRRRTLNPPTTKAGQSPAGAQVPDT